MRLLNIWLTICAGAAVAVQAASASKDEALSAKAVNAQQALVLLTVLELSRRFQKSDSNEPVIRALESPGQFDLNGIFGQLSAALPFDLSGLAGILNGGTSAGQSAAAASGSLGNVGSILSGLGITPPS